MFPFDKEHTRVEWINYIFICYKNIKIEKKTNNRAPTPVRGRTFVTM